MVNVKSYVREGKLPIIMFKRMDGLTYTRDNDVVVNGVKSIRKTLAIEGFDKEEIDRYLLQLIGLV
jgi:hypothetical protein